MTQRKTARILVVDDEPALREMLVDALGEEGVEIAAAGDRAEALRVARRKKVDLLVTDLHLPDGTGLDVIDRLRRRLGDLPAVVITGQHNSTALAGAARRRLLEVMTKPLDLPRLQELIRGELARRAVGDDTRSATWRWRKLARSLNADRRRAHRHLEETCAELTGAYHDLTERIALQQAVIECQNQLLACRSDDDIFAAFFRLFVRRSGPLHGVAMVCNEDAELQIAGRFGVPVPDNMTFCQELVRPLVGRVLAEARPVMVDAGDEADLFDESIRQFLPGLTAYALPLVRSGGEIVGMVVLYRKGEQPMLGEDTALGEVLAPAAAAAIARYL